MHSPPHSQLTPTTRMDLLYLGGMNNTKGVEFWKLVQLQLRPKGEDESMNLGSSAFKAADTAPDGTSSPC